MVYQKVTSEEVLDLYNQENKNINEIAKILNCNNVTVWMHFKKFGVNIKERFCLDCRKKYEVSHKYSKNKRCLECHTKRRKILLSKYNKRNYNKLVRLRKRWRLKNPNRKLNWLNLHKDQRHIKIRDKVEALLNKGFSEKEISYKVNIKLGRDSRDRFSIKWYKKCVNSKDSGKKVHKLYPKIIKNLILTTTRESRRKGALNLIKKLKKENRYNQHQSKAGKLGGLKGGPAAIKKQRENKPYYFMNVPFDSEQERRFCELLVKHGIIKKPIEGKNAHVNIGGKDFDFLIKEKFFIEYHPFDFYRTSEQYFNERRNTLNKNGFKNYGLIVIKNFNEFYEKVLILSR